MSGKEALALQISEKQLQSDIRDLCVHLGLLYYHTHDSRRSDGGFPDCVIVTPKMRIIFAELKNEYQSLSSEQKWWLRSLTAISHFSGGRVAVFTWRPSDWLSGEIEKEIRG